MTRNSCSITVEVMDTQNLSDEDLAGINEVTQDMWASESWLWELSQCTDCGRMISKEDAFGHLSKERFSQTVAQILREEGIDLLQCPHCRGDTRFIYGGEGLEETRKWFQDRVSFLVGCRNDLGKLVGYMNGYVDSLQTIFEQELIDHYSEIGFPAVSERVDSILGSWTHTMDFMSFSSMGLLESYISLFTIFKMFNAFFESIPDGYVYTPGITELDRNNNIHRIHRTMGCKTIWMADSEEYARRITNTGKGYQSDIVVYRTPVKDFRDNFAMGVKDFLRTYRNY